MLQTAVALESRLLRPAMHCVDRQVRRRSSVKLGEDKIGWIWDGLCVLDYQTLMQVLKRCPPTNAYLGLVGLPPISR